MSGRNILGWSILGTVAIGLFSVTAIAVGFFGAVGIWTFAIVLGALIVVAIELTIE